MQRVPNGALLLLLTCFSGLVYGEVAPNFNNCLQFFYKNKPPTGITGKEYKHICQFYNNCYRFATLYNKKYRTPLYSAYKVEIPDGNRPDVYWMIEPQLASNKRGKSMEFVQNPDQNIKHSQAVEEDYINSGGYTRGHLAPSSHQETEDGREATFTLTNIVPQAEGSNSGPWRTYEENLIKIRKACNAEMYVITGIMPYNNEEHKINNRVFIPEGIWSAYCCTDRGIENRPGNYPPTFAAVGRNYPKRGDGVVMNDPNTQGYNVEEMSLSKLERNLEKRLNTKVTLFDGICGALQPYEAQIINE